MKVKDLDSADAILLWYRRFHEEPDEHETSAIIQKHRAMVDFVLHCGRHARSDVLPLHESIGAIWIGTGKKDALTIHYDFESMCVCLKYFEKDQQTRCFSGSPIDACDVFDDWIAYFVARHKRLGI